VTPIELPGLVTQGDECAWAVTSPNNVYRYALGRCWAPGLPVFDITMINPSTARHDLPDPTMSKVVHYAKQEGCGSILIRNLAALSSANKADLNWPEFDVVGPRNAEVLALKPFYALRVAAWGNFPNERVRRRLLASVGQVKALPALHVFGFNTKTSEPKHPLYLKNSTRIQPWFAGTEKVVT
jgi:hypothetical protein